MNYLLFPAGKKRTVAGLISCLLIGFSLVPAARADDPDTAPSSGRSAGGRGCGKTMPTEESELPSLILLSQGDKTTSTRPKFSWTVRDAGSVAMEFRLYAKEGDNRYRLVKEIKDDQFKSAQGINVLSLSPQTTPELAIGRYRWQVILVCDRQRPSSNLFASAEIEVVPPGDLNMPQKDLQLGLLDRVVVHAIDR
jgi:Domain of Unknown Function (DUF928)